MKLAKNFKGEVGFNGLIKRHIDIDRFKISVWKAEPLIEIIDYLMNNKYELIELGPPSSSSTSNKKTQLKYLHSVNNRTIVTFLYFLFDYLFVRVESNIIFEMGH